MTWTPEKFETAKREWLKGASASYIQGLIGKSRNAVIGKMYREGVIRDAKTDPHKHKSRPKAPAKRAKKKWDSWIFGVRSHTPNPRNTIFNGRYMSEINDEKEIPAEQRVKFDDLRSHHCRWPVGDVKDKDFGYCGKPKIPGTSYCEDHYIRAHKVLPKKASKQIQGAA